MCDKYQNHESWFMYCQQKKPRFIFRWWSPAVNCSVDTSRSSTKVKTASELDLTNMFGVFIVLIACTGLAILYEIGATIYKYVRVRQKKKVIIVL